TAEPAPSDADRSAAPHAVHRTTSENAGRYRGRRMIRRSGVVGRPDGQPARNSAGTRQWSDAARTIKVAIAGGKRRLRSATWRRVLPVRGGPCGTPTTVTRVQGGFVAGNLMATARGCVAGAFRARPATDLYVYLGGLASRLRLCRLQGSFREARYLAPGSPH